MGDKVFDMYKNAELYKNARNSDPNSYKPVSNIATINNDPAASSKPTVTVSNYAKLNDDMLKYFGTTDTYAVYVPAAEQEYGAGKRKKPSTAQNKNLAGDNK